MRRKLTPAAALREFHKATSGARAAEFTLTLQAMSREEQLSAARAIADQLDAEIIDNSAHVTFRSSRPEDCARYAERYKSKLR